MTKKQAIVYLRFSGFSDEQIKAIEGAFSCEDAISRQAVLDQTYLWSKDEFLRVTNPFDYLRKRINSLPPVNPQEPKTGHWIFDEILDKHYYCSECKSMGVDYWDYCPNCGAKMSESEVSE